MSDGLANDVAAVLAGKSRWGVACSSWEDFLPTLPDDSIDLLVTSPPYLENRTYGIDYGKDAEGWASWMLEFVRTAQRKVTGLIVIVAEGETKGYRYRPGPFLLTANLFRAGFNLRKPAVFHRHGIMGSGGPDWLRNDWEPVICVTRPGRLPWSDNTAMGGPPKWEPGGPPTHRRPDGTRVSEKRQRVKELVGTGMSQRAAARVAGYPISTTSSRRRHGRFVTGKTYVPPEVCNPGNVIHCNVGGGKMGHDLAHENEAPFPVELPAFFVKSFCPPDGIVLDPFIGSGTTIQAAVECGRRAIGCDIRESQIKLTRRRMRTVTPALPGLVPSKEPAQ